MGCITREFSNRNKYLNGTYENPQFFFLPIGTKFSKELFEIPDEKSEYRMIIEATRITAITSITYMKNYKTQSL